MHSSPTPDIQKWQTAFSEKGCVKCWTLMERSTWRLLEEEGELTCPIDACCRDPCFQDAYAWMSDSMNSAGIRAPALGISPWWCWVRRDANHPEPYIEDGEGLNDPVVLQLSVPSEQIALSCFDLWHFVLNRCYVSASERDEQDFDRAKRSAEESLDPDPLLQLELEQRMQESWSAVFKLDQSAVDMGSFETKSIQGCFWVLRLTDVIAVMERDVLTSYDSISAD